MIRRPIRTTTIVWSSTSRTTFPSWGAGFPLVLQHRIIPTTGTTTAFGTTPSAMQLGRSLSHLKVLTSTRALRWIGTLSLSGTTRPPGRRRVGSTRPWTTSSTPEDRVFHSSILMTATSRWCGITSSFRSCRCRQASGLPINRRRPSPEPPKSSPTSPGIDCRSSSATST